MTEPEQKMNEETLEKLKSLDSLHLDFLDLSDKYTDKLQVPEFAMAIIDICIDALFFCAPSREECLRIIKGGVELSVKRKTLKYDKKEKEQKICESKNLMRPSNEEEDLLVDELIQKLIPVLNEYSGNIGDSALFCILVTLAAKSDFTLEMGLRHYTESWNHYNEKEND